MQDQKFDRRDVYIITQNALADGTYLCYIRAHYNRSTQIDPPFFSELLRTAFKDKDYQTNLLARAVAPLDRFFTALGARVEKRRRTYTSWFADKDFIDLPAFAAKLRPGPQQDPLSKYLYENLSPQTQTAAVRPGRPGAPAPQPGRGPEPCCWSANSRSSSASRPSSRRRTRWTRKSPTATRPTGCARSRSSSRSEIAELSKTGPLYEPERFKQVPLSEYLTDFIKENPQSWTRIRLNRLLLEAAYPKEIAQSLGGVYPDREIYSATPDDSQRCFQEYMADAQRRMQANQLKPGRGRERRSTTGCRSPARSP